jgi:hypothetical protein
LNRKHWVELVWLKSFSLHHLKILSEKCFAQCSSLSWVNDWMRVAIVTNWSKAIRGNSVGWDCSSCIY